MIRYRVLSAAVLIPLVLGVTYLGGLWFLGLVLSVLTLAGHEYARLLKRGDDGPSEVLIAITLWMFVLDAQFPQWQLLRLGLTLSVLGMLAWAVVRYEQGHASAVADWAWTAAGSLYIGWTGAHFVLVRNLNVPPQASLLGPVYGDGLWWTGLALGVTWLADTGAYLVGHTWGKSRMSPNVSPLKTWEGFVGGLILGAGGGVLLAWLIHLMAPWLGYPPKMSMWDGLALGLLISICSPLGDLGESIIKRHVGAKDSGHLIPGHGGMLDRIDSLLWAAVIAFYYVTWLAHCDGS